jgi:tRNA(Ile)-lysidine synthase
MARSHPPTLLKLTLRTLLDECAIAPGERILVAVSGGSDSSALLHVLSILAPRLGVTLVAHGVDHGLRPEAPAELDLAAALAEGVGVLFSRTRVEVAPGGNLQARARDARRRALSRAAQAAGATRIATAHHADDRAETVLIRLLHGASPSGLGVLPPTDGPYLRPLVRARKADVLAHLARHRLAFATDPSNGDRRFLRVRVRAEVLPLLEELSPAIVSHLTALADELGRGPPPIVKDQAGQPVALRRSQAQALHRAIGLGRSARIQLSGGREIVVEPGAAGLRLESAGAMNGRAGPPGRGKGQPKGQKGGAKSGKSG